MVYSVYPVCSVYPVNALVPCSGSFTGHWSLVTGHFFISSSVK